MEDSEQLPIPNMEACAPKAVERPLWVLSRDEQRVLIVTFVGGLASIIASACVIGGAIALARALQKGHFPLTPTYGTAAFILIGVLIITGLRSSSELLNFFAKLFLPLWGFPFALLLLAWIGIAAGIH